MKQTGNDWTTPDGKVIPKKYISAQDREYERLGQIIAEKANALSNKIKEGKAALLDLVKEAIDKAPNKPQKRFTFYTFDKGFRIEYDIKEGYVRVYKATKANPSGKDYEPVPLEFNRADMSSIEQPLTDADLAIDPESPEELYEQGFRDALKEPVQQVELFVKNSDGSHRKKYNSGILGPMVSPTVESIMPDLKDRLIMPEVFPDDLPEKPISPLEQAIKDSIAEDNEPTVIPGPTED